MLLLRLVLCTAFYGALIVGTATSQISDRLISGSSEIFYRIPAEIQIQSAARIGSTTIAIWGTTRLVGDTDAANQLVMQRIVDHLPQGTPVILHSGNSIPFGFIDILPANDKFIAVWNDRRPDSPGVYTRTIALDGHLVNDERRLAEGSIIQSFSYPWVPGIIIYVRDHRNTLAITVDSTIHVREFSSALSSLHWSFSSDESVITATDSSLLFFNSIADSAPRKMIAVPADSGLVTGTRIVTGDSSHGIHLYYCTIQNIGDPSYGGPVWYRLIKTDWSESEQQFVNQRDVDSVMYSSGTTSYILIGTSADINRRCRGSYEVSLSAYFYLKFPGFPAQSMTQNDQFNIIDERDSTKTGVATACLHPDALSVSRIGRGQSSDIAITDTPGTVVTLTTATASRRYGSDCIAPNILVEGDSLVVLWQQDLGKSRILAATWDPESGWPAHQITTMESDTWVPDSRLVAVNTLSVTPGAAIAIAQRGIRDYFFPDDPFHPLTNGIAWIYAHGAWHEASFPIIEDGVFRSDPYAPPFTMRSLSVDPNTRRGYLIISTSRQLIAASCTLDGDSLLWNIHVPGSGSENLSIIPLADDTCLIIGPGEPRVLYLLTAGHAIDTADAPVLDPDAKYVRLLGNELIGYVVSPDSLDIRIHNTHGALLTRRVFDGHDYSSPLFIAQNPIDSSIAILWGSPNGVRLLYLNRQLQILHDTLTGESLRRRRISAFDGPTSTPAAVFRNDTLFAVWMDYRNGASDIYGTAWKVPEHAISSIRDGSLPDNRLSREHPVISALIPNPASTRAVVRLELPTAEPTQILVSDMLGRTVQRIPVPPVTATEQWIQIDVSTLVDGVYMIAIAGRERSANAHLVVMHQR